MERDKDLPRFMDADFKSKLAKLKDGDICDKVW